MNDIQLLLSAHSQADFTETNSNKGWIDYGADNLFPQYLVNLYQSSPTHTALVNSIAAMIYGEGFYPTELDSRLAWKAWDMDSELRKSILDLKIQGGFYLDIIWGKEGIANVSHYPFQNYRAAEAEEDHITGYWYSSNWEDATIEPEFIPAFNPSIAKANTRQTLCVKVFSPGSFYYPKPDYIGAINYIELEREIAKFHLNNIHNGLSPSFAIHFKNGAVDPEERASIRREIENQMSGAKGAGKVWITYSDLPELTPDFEPIQLSDADKQYQFLSTECTDKIMIGHRVTNPMLFGVLAPGKLGGGSEMAESQKIFEENVISYFQQIVIDTCNTLLNAAKLGGKVEKKVAEGELSGDVEQSYTGIQVSSALEIMARVKIGELTETQAINLLVTMLKFPLDVAQALFATQLSADEPNLHEALNYLQNCGEIMGDEWELIDARPVDYDAEEHWQMVEMADSKSLFGRVREALAKTKVLKYSNTKSEQDNSLYRVRYAYAPGDYKDNSRDFCKGMVNAGKVYRMEDIKRAARQSVNPGFGPRGANTYDIWLYKGGARCYHFWERRTYIQKGNREASVNEVRRMITKLPVDVRDKFRLPVNPPEVAQRPVDMPNQGFLNPR
jgi:hypothetical protein